ncbi:MAG: GAF domain-containing protein [Ardenticatenaceae bacterium]|nr:GAF domain-containing protein [Ardenticatenaceae bacterium]MCB9446302.1 GAF domain-containing protein [Ardenticatenaceae bacterium]
MNATNQIGASQRLETIYAVNNKLKQVEAEGLHLNHILPQILDIAVKQLNAKDGSIIVVDQEMQIEHAWLADKKSTAYLDDIMNNGLAGWVIRNQQPAIIDDTHNDPRWLPKPTHFATEEGWSVICVPFIIRSRAVGAITIHKAQTYQFNNEDLELLTIISNQASATIENARLYERSQRQLQISALLNEASRVINSSLDINQIMQSLLSQMNEFLHAQALSIALVDKQTNELVYQVAEGIGSEKIIGLRLPSNQGLSGWVMENAKPACVNDTSQDPRFHTSGDKRTGYITQAMICAPVQFKNEVLGTIQAINPVQGKFTQDDLALLINLANIASSAVAHAQQYARIQAAEARYTRLFQDSISPIVLTDLEGNIVEANRQASQFMGYDREVLRQMNIKQLHPDNTEWPPFGSIQSDTLTVLTNKVVTKIRELIYVEVYAKRTLSDNTEFLQWIYRDISKQIELEVMRDDMTAMLFHDLQSPLGNVITSLELLQMEIPPESDDTLQMMLDIAMRSSRRLQTLIRSLLDINQLEAGHPVSNRAMTDIYKLVDEVYETERPHFEKRDIEFVREMDTDLPLIFVDEDMIRRVLINLVDNAIKYGYDSDAITLVVTAVPESDHIFFSVRDQGPGIPPQYRQTIFDKFERIQRESESKGLGLGLAFCRLAVEAHNGRIWVGDAPGGGAAFNFNLPLVDPEA